MSNHERPRVRHSAWGDWLYLSQCGAAMMDDASDALEIVSCHGLWCAPGWAEVVEWRIAVHTNRLGGKCLWSGLRIVDDRGDLPAAGTVRAGDSEALPPLSRLGLS
ncbi:hypothetical protein [Nocardia colli]|uniref:hypothetical protein n=1 Tax=Nocardia colli TaxID=2545717 RepID=UPI0035D881E1